MKHCPTCHQPIKEDVVLPIRKALSALRRERKGRRKETMTHAAIKRLFIISNGHIDDEIPSVVVFGERRYDKEDVLAFVQSRKIKYQGKMHL